MLRTFEKLFAAAMLIYGSGALWVLFGPVQKLGPAEGNSSALAAQMGFHIVAAGFYVLHSKKIALAIIKTPWLIALVLFAVASTAWSQDPNLTFRRSLILIGTALFGLYFGTRFELKQQINILSWALLSVLIASAAVSLLIPHIGVEGLGHLGNWRGLLSQKNGLARLSVLAVLAFTAWKPPIRGLAPSAIAFAIVVLVMTRSDTGLLVMCTLVASMRLLRSFRRKAVLLIPVVTLLFGSAIAIGLTFAENMNSIWSVLGRNSTLTGRTDLWAACLISISKRPVLGYGFDAFWLGMIGESAKVNRYVHWVAPNAHNGALDLLLSLGTCGLALFVLAYLICARKSFTFYLREPARYGVWPLAYMAFMLLYNLTEVTEMEQNSIFTILFAAVAATVTVRAANLLKQDTDDLSFYKS